MAKSKFYFTQETEDYIIKYNKSNNPTERNEIYKTYIAYAFDKLAENIIHTFKFYYFDVKAEKVKHEVVSFLVLNMHKYQENKGKAFSYFSIVAKNYLILHNNNNYKKFKTHDKIGALDFARNVESEIAKEEIDIINEEFIDQMIEYWENNLTNIFKKRRDIEIADSVLHLFRMKQNIENFNRKALYILIRERTGAKTQYITRVINVMKRYHLRLYEEYYVEGKLDVENTGSTFIVE